MPPHTFVISEDDAKKRLDQILKKRFPHMPYGLIQKCFRKKDIRVNGKSVRQPPKVQRDDEIQLFFPLDDHHLPPKPPSPHILERAYGKYRALWRQWCLFEDDHVLVLNKPAGIPCQAGTSNPHSLDRILAYVLEKPVYLCHRLDIETTGVSLWAKTPQSARHLTTAFRERQVKKTYHALVHGMPKSLQGTIDTPLEKKWSSRAQEGTTLQKDRMQDAKTHYKVLFHTQSHAYVVLHPETGRKHQVRRHCRMLGIPLVGDKHYGTAALATENRHVPLCLHAAALTFPHPLGHDQEIKAPLPEAYVKTAGSLGLSQALQKDYETPLRNQGGKNGTSL